MFFDRYLSVLGEALRMLFGHPGSMAEWATMATLGIALFVLILTIVGRAFGCAMADPGRCLAMLIVTAGLPLAAVAVAGVHLVPLPGGEFARRAIPIALALAAVGAAVVPIGRAVLKGSYAKVLMALLIAGAAAALGMTMARAGFRAARAGEEGLAPARERLEQARETMP